MNTESIMPEAENITPEVGRQKQRKVPGVVSQRLIDNLSKAEHLIQVAQNQTYAIKLTTYGLDASFIQQLSANATQCRIGITMLSDKKGARLGATGEEGDRRSGLLGMLQEAQAVAKLQLTLHPTETHLKARYFIGTALRTMSRASLESATDQILAHLKTDHFIGFGADKIATLEAALTLWRGTEETQGNAQSSAVTIRRQLVVRFAEVEKQRRALQLAADAAFPYTDGNNAGIRREFHLPLHGPIKRI